MRKCDIKTLLNEAMNPRILCSIFMKYDANWRWCFPLVASDKLFLVANENDFILNGFTIRRFRDIIKAETKDGKFLEIARAEGLVDGINVPNVCVDDWYSVFVSLQHMDQNIIVEKEDGDDEEQFFVIGRIKKVTKTKVYMHHFDADGVWEESLWEIPFAKISSVSFGVRYVEVFSKYI